jgi:predicted dehydrogenase
VTGFGLGIIGCGGAAIDFCRAMDTIPGLRLVAAYDRDEKNAAELAAPRGAAVAPSQEALLAGPAVNIVYVALPHFLLAGAVEAALRAGKHVLTEKPLALSADEARRLGHLADERNLRLGVFFELRKSATVRTARELVAGGAIGAIRAVRIETLIDKPLSYWQSGYSGRVNDSWRAQKANAGGGVVLMNSIHQIDALRFITGLEITEVTGMVATLSAGVEVEDAAGAVFHLANGALGTLVANAHSIGAENAERISVDGEFGRIDLPYALSSAPIQMFLRRDWQHYAAGEWLEIPASPRDSYAEMLKSFVAAVDQGTPPSATAIDAAAALSVIQALYESSRSGQAVAPET